MSTRATDAGTDIRDSILDTIGDTPLVRLRRSAPGCTPSSWPRSSSSTPAARSRTVSRSRMIEAAERDGRLRPGGTIIEPTSGNTGTGLAIAARLKGYRVIAVMPDKMSQGEDRPAARLRRRGRGLPDRRRARLAAVLLPRRRPPDRRRSRARSSPTSTSTRPTRRRTTSRPGPRSGARPAARLTHLVVGVGTGGTITGMARYLKEQNPDIEIIGADPEGSIYSGERGPAVPRRGRGRGLLARDLRPVGRRPLRDASPTATRSSRRAGSPRPRGCCSAAPAASPCTPRSRSRARSTTPRRSSPSILPDGGRAYLSKIFNDAWMTPVRLPRRARRTGRSATCCAPRRGRRDPAARGRRRRGQKVRDAIALLHEHRVSQLPVVSAHDRRRDRRLGRRARAAQARHRRRRR